MKKLLKIMLMMTLCYSFALSARAGKLSPDFVKSVTPNSRTPRLAGRSSDDFAELEITIKNGMLTPVSYIQPTPLLVDYQ